jgi:hypothetical protein
MAAIAAPFPIPRRPDGVAASLLAAQIGNRAVEAVFRGQVIPLRFAEPSMRRQIEVAGYTEEMADLEVLIVIDGADDPPRPNFAPDYLSFAPAAGQEQETWRIIATTTLPATGGYQLTLTRTNPRRANVPRS